MSTLSKFVLTVPENIVTKYNKKTNGYSGFEDRITSTVKEVREIFDVKISFKEALLYFLVSNEDVKIIKKIVLEQKHLVPDKTRLYWYDIITQDYSSATKAYNILTLLANETNLIEVQFRDLFDAYPNYENIKADPNADTILKNQKKYFLVTWDAYTSSLRKKPTKSLVVKWYKKTMDAYEEHNKGGDYPTELKEFIKNYFEKM